MTEREKEYLNALRRADRALENLWKKSTIGSRIFEHTSYFQCAYIHPEIRKINAEAVKEEKPNVQPL